MTSEGTFHAGLFFADGEEASAIHLAWENAIQFTWKDLVSLSTLASPVRQKRRFLAGICRKMRKLGHQAVPYNFGFEGYEVNEEGELVVRGVQTAVEPGLTCATFVLAVLKAATIEPLDLSTWKARTDEDRVFLQSLRGLARIYPVVLARLQAAVDAEAPRVRPAEVYAGACAAQKMTFDDAVPAGKVAEEELRSKQGPIADPV
jgi:hypothetical protein